MQDRSAIPNPVVDATSGTESTVDPNAPFQPDDIEARREAMKSFAGKEPAVTVPIPSALDARREDEETSAD